MSTDMPSSDMLVFGVIILIIALLVLVVDFIIFCYWLSFKYKEYNFQQSYGPVIKFPPRESDQFTASLPEQTSDFEPDDIALSLTPNTQLPTPDTKDQTPVSFAPPEYDFLPANEPTEEQVEDESSTEHPSAHEADDIALCLTPNTQHQVSCRAEQSEDAAVGAPIDTSLASSESPPSSSSENYPALRPDPLDPLEDFRPIDSAVLGAYGGIRSPFAATWSLVHPFVGIQVVLAAVNVLSAVLIIPLFPKLMSGTLNMMTSPYFLAVIIISLFLQNAGFVGITAYLLKGYGTSLQRIGLRAPTKREIVLGLVCGAGLCLAAVVLERALDVGASHFVSRQFIDRMGKLTDRLSAGGQFEQIHSVTFQIWFILAGAVAAPIGEEVFFRGLLYNGLKKRWGVTAGVILSGICFGLIHFAPIAVLIIIPMGCVLALVYERTKSLWVTILMHAFNNGAQLLFAMYTMHHAAHH